MFTQGAESRYEGPLSSPLVRRTLVFGLKLVLEHDMLTSSAPTDCPPTASVKVPSLPDHDACGRQPNPILATRKEPETILIPIPASRRLSHSVWLPREPGTARYDVPDSRVSCASSYKERFEKGYGMSEDEFSIQRIDQKQLLWFNTHSWLSKTSWLLRVTADVKDSRIPSTDSCSQ